MDFIYLNLLNLLGDFSLFQVSAGAVLLFASVILTFQIKKNIPDDLRTEWRKTSNFILFFFTGYVLFILILLGQLSYSIEPVTASLFLVSACFVYLIMMLIKTFTIKMREKDIEIKGFIGKLKENNDSLEHEITVRKKTEERLRLYEKAVETMQVGVTIVDTRGIISYTNPADALMHGFDPEELAGKDVGIFAPAGRRKPMTMEQMLDVGTLKREGVNVRRDGSLFPVQLISSSVLNPDGEPIGVVTVCEDITERKQAEEKLVMYKDHLEELVRARTSELTRAFEELKSETIQRRNAEEKVTFMAYHDSLTGLPNRYSLLDMLGKMLDGARGGGRLIAAMFLDLDNFKRINDTLGHGIGDRLLQGVAERLSGSLRLNDAVVHVEDGELKKVVSRLGGDEFVVLLAGLHTGQDAEKVAERLLGTIARPYNLDGHEVYVTTSIGISMFPEHGEDPENLLKHADFAMYHAKGQGRNTFRFYKEELHAIAAGRLTMEHNLITALKRDEFHVCYQPQFSIPDGGVIGMESLVRWKHPELGLVSPAEFIPVAEENGLIVPIGEWIMRTVCSHYNRWKYHGEQDFRVAVNLSGYQFRQSTLLETIKRSLDEFDMPAHSLEVELTEGIVMRDAEETVTILKALKDMGIRISIDDFGTGYSSLSYLKRFPIDTLKIDQSFVRDVSKSNDDASIVRTIIAMGHSLNMTVIAEGVETQEQLDFLRDNGCDAMQGFLFCKPLPQEEVSKLIENNWNFGG